MRVAKDNRRQGASSGALHKKATYTLPPDVIASIGVNWRFHKTLDSSLADSKSEYVADLIRRDALRKAASTPKR